MKKAINFFTAHPARFFLAVALFWVGILSLLNYIFGVHVSLNDLLEDARDMVFDLLVFGVLLSIYEALREKRDKIERLHEEIDDYRGWDEKEDYGRSEAIRQIRCFKLRFEFLFPSKGRPSVRKPSGRKTSVGKSSVDKS